MLIKRRGLLRSLFAAPAIVAAPSLMRVSTMPSGIAYGGALGGAMGGSGVFVEYSGYRTLSATTLDIREYTLALWREVAAQVAQVSGIPDEMRGWYG